MTDLLVLTFAEIEFLLSVCPGRADAVRAHLRATDPDQEPAVVRAGLASLLARGLCLDAEGSVTPGPEAAAVIAAFSTAQRHIAAAGWRGDRPEVMHLYTGEAVRLALFPTPLGRYAVEFLNLEELVSAPLMRFVDAFADSSGGGRESALVLKSQAFAESGEVDDSVSVSIAVSIDAAGTWTSSDSEQSPDKGVPASRDQVARRIAELMDGPGNRPAQASA
ncbi:MAG TPA: hypothetical protein VFU73_08315 [Actinocrinis sp.]|nr:hypothetical protein [Actinocrinis sp.]